MAVKKKLVLQPSSQLGGGQFRIIKSVNTLDFGVPGDILNRAEVDKILKSDPVIRRGELTVEINKAK